MNGFHLYVATSTKSSRAGMVLYSDDLTILHAAVVTPSLEDNARAIIIGGSIGGLFLFCVLPIGLCISVICFVVFCGTAGGGALRRRIGYPRNTAHAIPTEPATQVLCTSHQNQQQNPPEYYVDGAKQMEMSSPPTTTTTS